MKPDTNALQPCTDLAVSGARHFAAKIADGRQAVALQFVRDILNLPFIGDQWNFVHNP